jgi:hypothetical protein
VEKELREKFEIKSLGEPSMLLGMKVSHDKEKQIVTLSQTHYIDKIIERVGLQDANPVSTPLNLNVNLEVEETEGDNDQEIDNRASSMYAKAIGSLMYAAIGTRPDIAFAVHLLARFTKSPKPKHWTAVKRVFRYLKKTREYSLTYGGSDQTWEPELTMYCDADWASSSDRKSISGYIFCLLEEPYPGVQRSKQPLHCQPQKLSTSPQHTLPNKSYGIDLYSMNSKYNNPRLQYYSRIIKLLSLYHTILNFTHAPNISTLHTIFYVI